MPGSESNGLESPPLAATVPEPGGRLQRFMREWRGFFVFVALMFVFRSVVADWNHVPTGSMRPTLLVGDRVVVNKIAFDLRVPFTFIRLAQFAHPQRGDVITFETADDGRLLIKRVVGVPGDRVALMDNRLTVNGEPASYTPLLPREIMALKLPDAADFDIFGERVQDHTRVVMHVRNEHSGYSTFVEQTVPPGHYLVLGDNRDRSGDFRLLGYVPRELVLGRAHTVAFSFNYDRWLWFLPRAGRFFHPLRDTPPVRLSASSSAAPDA